MSVEMVNPAPEPEQHEAFVINMAQEDDPTEQLIGRTLSGDPVKDYLKAIGKTPLLNAELEVELAKTIEAGLLSEQLLAARQKGQAQTMALGETAAKFARASNKELAWLAQTGRDAKRQMQEANLRLVVSIAKKYAGRDMEFLDLIQEGNRGLNHAVEKFDFAKGYKFSTYATWWIRQSITRAMADMSRTIRLPVHMIEKINLMERTERRMLSDLGRNPTNEELAQELKVTVDKIADYQKYAQRTISLDAPLGDGDGPGRGQSESYRQDVIVDTTVAPPEEVVEYAAFQADIRRMLDTLDTREAGIVTLRYGLDGNPSQTLDEISRVYGVSRERIRQIESKALSKLREPSRSAWLRDYLE